MTFPLARIIVYSFFNQPLSWSVLENTRRRVWETVECMHCGSVPYTAWDLAVSRTTSSPTLPAHASSSKGSFPGAIRQLVKGYFWLLIAFHPYIYIPSFFQKSSKWYTWFALSPFHLRNNHERLRVRYLNPGLQGLYPRRHACCPKQFLY